MKDNSTSFLLFRNIWTFYYLPFNKFFFKKLDVQKAPNVEEHPQWNFPDEDGNKEGSENERDDEFAAESESDS